MTVLSKWKAARFVAWDSEGFDINGSHEVALLANSSGAFLMRGGRALTTSDCLHWIVDGMMGKHRRARHEAYSNATHVIFGGSYDANMWLRDLQPIDLQRLWEGNAAYFHDGGATFRIEYRPRKFFMVHRSYNDFAKGSKSEGGIIWDVIGFFQSTFVDACRDNGLGQDIDEIERMKMQRDQFTAADLSEILPYCLRECDLLKKLCERLHSDIAAAEIQIARWDGAGALAAALLRQYGVMGFQKPLPERVDHAARYAYFGGRIELVKFGTTTSKVWKYDINSAYPAAATLLPCLAHGQWEKVSKFEPNVFGVWRVTARTPANPANIAALPYRAKGGRVYFPWTVSGWYWTPEVRAAREFGAEMDVRSGYVWRPDCDHLPFTWLSKLYRYRQQLKKYGGAGQKAIKLGINSCYGKLAQTAGGEKKIPTWHNLAWAGFITSQTRAVLYRAAMQAGDDLIALATDAVFSMRPLDLPCTSKLGEWDATEYEGMTSLQSGVYWLGGNRYAPDARRGFDGKKLKLDDVLDCWRNGVESVHVPMRVFVGMGLAMRTDMASWRQWKDAPKDINLWPDGTKRTMRTARTRAQPWRRMELTQPTDPYTHGVEMSRPTVRPWDKTRSQPLADDLRLEPPEMCEALEWQV